MIARFLKLPVDATYSEMVPRLARVLTRDGFIEDLSWKYLVWFYNQVDAVYVSSARDQRTLEDKGVAMDKLRLFAPSFAQLRAPDHPTRHSFVGWR